MIDFLGTKRRAERKQSEAKAKQLGEEGGHVMGEAINSFTIARVTPALEGALVEFRARASVSSSRAGLQAELATFLEWLEEARDELAAERSGSLAQARRMADAIDSLDHFEAVLGSRLAREAGRIAMAAFDYAGVLAERLPEEGTDSAAVSRLSEAMVRIGSEEVRSEARVDFARSRV